ncbi:MAG: TraR/DksA C4-type zinc finger protein [Armatimonadetes bacterium]|nr:TraR/DksA C4-type zinc finger protein [Armatimonadota bacterium]
MTGKSRSKVAKYKKLLEQRRDELRTELRRLEDRAAGRDGEQEVVAAEDFDEPGGDAAADAAERQQARVMANEVKEILELVEEALRRIERGEYGVCEVCHKPIPAARLDLIPWATRCAKCAAGTSMSSPL